jgi:predicted dehydrogenase
MRCSKMMFAAFLTLLTLAASWAPAGEPAKKLRAGVIGLDTSHVMAYLGALSSPKVEGDMADVKIVAAYPGGSPDLPSSWDRVKGYTEQYRKAGVEIVDSIDELLKRVDVVFLESVDGRPHLAQVRPVLAAHKPVFVDKPCAGTLADVIEIFRLAKESGTPCFSSSSLRYSPEFQQMLHNPKIGEIRGAESSGPCSLEEHHPDLFWYGIHAMESLYTVMGTGCKTVARSHTDLTDVAVGVWGDGRIGIFRGKRDGNHSYTLLVFGSKGTAFSDKYGGYAPLLAEVCKFFKSGKPPVSAEETIELFAFMEAADESKRQGGCPVTLESVIAKARPGAK